MPRRTLITLRASPEAIRRETFEGIEHLVVPVVALVEGVIRGANSEGPELVTEEEFAKVVESWNGRPVTVNHPKKDGIFVSANSPDIHEENVIGTIFNTSSEGDKLKLEAWINLEKVKDVEGAQELVEALERGDQVEISTGYFADAVPQTGIHNGDKFIAVQKDIKPDHLALLTDSTGACSWEDGCGAPRVNCSRGNCSCSGTARVMGEMKHLGAILGFRNNRELSDVDLRTALEIALKASEPNEFFWIVAVFKDNVVYEKGFNTLVRRGFSVSDDGSITLNEETEEVRPETEFVPVSANEVNDMDKEAFIAALIANAATRFTDEHKDWLMTLEEDQLESMAPAEVTPKPEPDPQPEPDPEPNPEPDPDPQHAGDEGEGESTEPVTAEQYIAQAPPEVREVLREHMKVHKEDKDAIVKRIMANERNVFSEEDLKSRGIDELRSLAALAGVDMDYSGRGAIRTHRSDDDDAPPQAPVPIAIGGSQAA